MYTVEQTAKMLNVSRPYIRTLLIKKKLKGTKIAHVWVIDKKEVERFKNKL